jgi:hypothetical protein
LSGKTANEQAPFFVSPKYDSEFVLAALQEDGPKNEKTIF